MAQSIYHSVTDGPLPPFRLANAGRMDTGPFRQLVLRYANTMVVTASGSLIGAYASRHEPQDKLDVPTMFGRAAQQVTW